MDESNLLHVMIHKSDNQIKCCKMTFIRTKLLILTHFNVQQEMGKLVQHSSLDGQFSY